MRRILLIAVAASLAAMLSGSASVTVQSWYKLGEDGVGFSKLPKDSSGNGRDFLVSADNSDAGVSVETSGPAPGSSQYYALSADLTGFSDTGWDPPENNVGVECWAQSHDLFFDTFSTVGTLVFGTGNNLNGLGILYNDFGAGFIGVIGNVNYVGLPYLPTRTNEWVHLAVVRDNGVTTFYVNGVARTPIRTDGVNDSSVAFMGYTTGAGKTNFNGAIDEARIFTFNPGEFHPNDLQFYQATNTLPYVTTFKGGLDGFLIRLQDKATAVNPDTIAVKLDSADVVATKSQAGGVTTIQYTTTAYLASGSAHTVNLVFADTAGTFQTNDLIFTVAPYTSVPAAYAMPPGAVDTTKPGFQIRPYQTEAAQPNNLAWTEDQLIGLYGENIANLAGANAQGFLEVAGVINFSIESGTGIDRGNFVDDLVFPGIPGIYFTTGNSTIEVVTFLQFPSAGVYTMGVNSDDGFKVTTGPNPRDRFALVLGRFDAGRGAADTLFTFTIPQPGFFPFRLIWENGNGELDAGNQANCEWFIVQADGTKVLVNSSASPVKAYRAGPLPPFVSRLVPAIAARGVLPSSSIEVDLTDGTSQVNQNSIQLGLNGGALGAPTSVTKAGAVTKAVLVPAAAFAPSSLITAELAWGDNGSYSVTRSWQFTTLDATLPSDLWSPLGSGDGTKRGFRVRTWQVNKFTANGTANSGIVNEVPVGNSLLLGVWGPNIADLSQAVDGEFSIPGVINWNRDAGAADIGNFQTPEYPDDPIPGIPGTNSDGNASYEDLAVEALTYVEFPTSGVFTMGVNSDDGFRVTAAEAAAPGSGAMRVVSPANKAGDYCALATYAANGGLFGGPWPRPRLVRPLVAVTDGSTENNGPGVNVGDSYMFLINPPVNAADLRGNIAVTRRGGGIAFTQKAKFCQDAGALAVIIVNRADQAGQKPWGMGGSDPSVTIPCIMVDWDAWVAIMDVTTTNATTTQVTLSLTDDDSPMLGQFDGGKGSADVLFSFFVPQAGVYPLRLMYEQGQGGANCEWFSLDALGNKVLLNNAANPNALKSFRARTESPKPTISLRLEGANVVLTFTGVLQAADHVTGLFADVPGAISPKSIPVSEAAQRFYRARQ